MLEKELAKAAKLAEQANKEVAKLKKQLLAETEKASAKAKRELAAARKKHGSANDRLKKARASLKNKKTDKGQQRVDELKAARDGGNHHGRASCRRC